MARLADADLLDLAHKAALAEELELVSVPEAMAEVDCVAASACQEPDSSDRWYPNLEDRSEDRGLDRLAVWAARLEEPDSAELEALAAQSAEPVSVSDSADLELQAILDCLDFLVSESVSELELQDFQGCPEFLACQAFLVLELQDFQDYLVSDLVSDLALPDSAAEPGSVSVLAATVAVLAEVVLDPDSESDRSDHVALELALAKDRTEAEPDLDLVRMDKELDLVRREEAHSHRRRHHHNTEARFRHDVAVHRGRQGSFYNNLPTHQTSAGDTAAAVCANEASSWNPGCKAFRPKIRRWANRVQDQLDSARRI